MRAKFPPHLLSPSLAKKSGSRSRSSLPTRLRTTSRSTRSRLPTRSPSQHQGKILRRLLRDSWHCERDRQRARRWQTGETSEVLTTIIPIVAAIALALTWGSRPGGVVVAIIAVVLIGAIAGAVHHAEVVAHRVGEPFGSIVLAVAVTVIEVALIVTLMVSGGPETSTLARDTVFAAVMITTNGIVGLALWIGTRHHGMAIFNAEGQVPHLRQLPHSRGSPWCFRTSP